mmetsp:Transcript_30657/g.91744  ORF Transcript_30657/g.91744 Transcript_30657/m.91744 type:complete len:433 (+) Transcript_30657:186-1484(+)
MNSKQKNKRQNPRLRRLVSGEVPCGALSWNATSPSHLLEFFVRLGRCGEHRRASADDETRLLDGNRHDGLVLFLLLVPDEGLPELVVGEASQAKGREDAEPSSKGHGPPVAKDDVEAFLERPHVHVGVKVHRVNVQRGRDSLHGRRDGQCHGEFRGVPVPAVLLHHVIGRAGRHVEGGIHRAHVAHGEESHRAHGHLGSRRLSAARDGGRVGVGPREDAVAPDEQTHVGEARRGDLAASPLLFVFAPLHVEGELAQVHHGVGAEVDGEREAETQPSEEGARVGHHGAGGLGGRLRKAGPSHEASIDDGHQGADEGRSGGGAGDFLGRAFDRRFREAVGVGVGVADEERSDPVLVGVVLITVVIGAMGPVPFVDALVFLLEKSVADAADDVGHGYGWGRCLVWSLDHFGVVGGKAELRSCLGGVFGAVSSLFT